MPRIEIHYTSQLLREEIQVIRSNVSLDGYTPLKSEVEGIWNLLSGAGDCLSAWIAPVTNEKMGIEGYARFKDGAINIAYSPITYLALIALAFWQGRKVGEKRC